MRDYYPLITRIVAGLDSNTGESRRVLYGRARAELCEQLREMDPPLTDSEITHERLSLEAAIRRFEADAIRRPRNAPVDATIAAAPDQATEARPLPGGTPPGARVGPRRLWRNAQQRGPRAAPREQLVELALLAQVFEARERQAGKLVGVIRVGERSGTPDTPRQRHTRANESVSGLPAAPQVAAVQELLAKLIDARQGHRPGTDPSSRPRRRSLADAPRRDGLFTSVIGILYFVFGFAQLVAFFHGLQTGFGLGGVASIGIFMLLYLTGSLGSIPMAIVAFYGAWRGWQWPIWGAALFSFPFVILSFAFLGVGGFYNFFNRQTASPIIPAGDWRSLPARWQRRARAWGALLRLLSIPGKAPQGRPRAGRW